MCREPLVTPTRYGVDVGGSIFSRSIKGSSEAGEATAADYVDLHNSSPDFACFHAQNSAIREMKRVCA
jgi:hypothetical protein